MLKWLELKKQIEECLSEKSVEDIEISDIDLFYNQKCFVCIDEKGYLSIQGTL